MKQTYSESYTDLKKAILDLVIILGLAMKLDKLVDKMASLIRTND